MSTPNKQSSRETSLSSTVSLVIYHNRMTMHNDKDGDVIMDLIDMFQLLYVTLEG